MNANREKKKKELERKLNNAFRNLRITTKPTKAERMKAYENEIIAIFRNKNLGKKK
jgi:hypothetical protein